MVRLISLSVYYLQTFQVVSINYVQLLICQSYLNKVVKKKKSRTTWTELERRSRIYFGCLDKIQTLNSIIPRASREAICYGLEDNRCAEFIF